ncbi:uncharacterized protein LOC126558281 [Anopheles maculipalpis]|uniref:uncharacterized protein LOC126558281 n=1 Tax=Anopheles maculipalpis TaxID=1496333 RepID=UPI002159A38E|nr:uncharacterized protein LOC126558281 [Anopheles maculipalpis]
MGEFYRIVLAAFVVVVILPHHECNPFFYYRRPVLSTSSSGATSVSSIPSPAQQSNVTVALGNRINTDTGLDDYGTNIDGLTVNVVRRRRRRDIWDLSSILGPNAPNGSYIAINNQIFPLPDNLSNVSLNVSSLSNSHEILNISQSLTDSLLPAIPENYTNAFHTLVTGFETLPLDFMDNIVRLLSSGYQNTFRQLFLERSFTRLNQTLNRSCRAVRYTLDTLANQTEQGLEQLSATFNGASSAVQRCVGTNLNPTNAARYIADKGFNCINPKWQELKELAGNIAEDVVAADEGASEFLANLTACNGSNYNGSDLSTAQQTTLRRQCYVRTIGSFPQPLLFLPISLAIDGAKLNATVASFETELGACAADAGLEIGMQAAQIGTQIVLCQLFNS